LKIHTESPWKLVNGHWVAPVTMVTEGVMCGSDGCLLWPAATIQAMADKWHDIPLVLGHPYGPDGRPVSVKARPDHIIGTVKNPVYDPITKSLRATIRVPEFLNGIHQLQQLREVSVGVFTNNVVDNGQHRGKRFVGRVTIARPDHLALLPEGQTGACDWSSGCGVRAYSEIDDLRAIARQTITALVNDLIKGGNIMANHEHMAVLPPEVYAASREQDELQTLKEWENFPGQIPPEILELQFRHNNKRQDRSGSGHESQAVYPIGVE